MILRPLGTSDWNDEPNVPRFEHSAVRILVLVTDQPCGHWYRQLAGHVDMHVDVQWHIS